MPLVLLLYVGVIVLVGLIGAVESTLGQFLVGAAALVLLLGVARLHRMVRRQAAEPS